MRKFSFSTFSSDTFSYFPFPFFFELRNDDNDKKKKVVTVRFDPRHLNKKEENVGLVVLLLLLIFFVGINKRADDVFILFLLLPIFFLPLPLILNLFNRIGKKKNSIIKKSARPCARTPTATTTYISFIL